jgi:hypothetical protein
MSFNPDKTTKLLFACLDWRLHPAIENYFATKNVACDMCITAGSIKDLINHETQNFFIKQIETSKNLHYCQEAILTMHMDCGAYGGSAAFSGREEEIACYTEDLRRAKEIIAGCFPGLAVKTWLVGLDEKNGEWKISPEEIKLV